jgi:hypothetical protein
VVGSKPKRRATHPSTSIFLFKRPGVKVISFRRYKMYKVLKGWKERVMSALTKVFGNDE